MKRAGNSFTVELPDDWEDHSIYIFNGPEIGGLRHDLRLVVEPEVYEDTLDEFARDRIDIVLESMQGMEVLKEEQKTLPNGTPAYESVIKWVPVDDRVIFQKRVYLLIGRTGYTFSANFTKQTMKTVGLQVNRIIESFKPIAPEPIED